MAKSMLAGVLLVATVFGQTVLASPVPRLAFDEQSAGNSNKKQADNPKKPSKAKDPKATEKVKTDDRMSTRGLKPPPKDADSDKPATKPDTTNPK